MTAPRDAIAHSQFDDETQDLLLAVYDRLQREFGMDEETGLKAVDVLLALADAGERSYSVLLAKSAAATTRGVEQDVEPQND